MRERRRRENEEERRRGIAPRPTYLEDFSQLDRTTGFYGTVAAD